LKIKGGFCCDIALLFHGNELKFLMALTYVGVTNSLMRSFRR